MKNFIKNAKKLDLRYFLFIYQSFFKVAKFFL